MYHKMHVCRSESVLSFYRIGPGKLNSHTVRFGNRCLYPVSHLADPHNLPLKVHILNNKFIKVFENSTVNFPELLEPVCGTGIQVFKSHLGFR